MIEEKTILELSVNETIRRYPATVAVFNEYGIDACCGGALPVDDAVVDAGADRAAFVAELLRAIREAA